MPTPPLFRGGTRRSCAALARIFDARMPALSRRQHAPGRHVVRDELPAKLRERTGHQVRADVLHDFQEHVRVVDADHPQPKDFVYGQQMTQIGPRETLAREAIAAFFNRSPVALVSPALDAEGPFAREGSAIAGYSRGKNAIEHVYAPRHQ